MKYFLTLKAARQILEDNIPKDEATFEIREVYRDFGQNWMHTTIVMNYTRPDAIVGSFQLLHFNEVDALNDGMMSPEDFEKVVARANQHLR